MDPIPTPAFATLSPSRLAATPHRLLFFIGASNLLLAMAWWSAWLVATRWPALLTMPQTQPYAGWLHAYVMQYQMLPSFIFGFLLTVFPRWMGLPDLERWRYVPVGLGLFGGQLYTLLGAMGWGPGITVGLWLTLGGWCAGLLHLTPLLWREKGATWHARSCWAALLLGLAGLLCLLAYVLGGSALWAFASIKLGTFGLLLPVFLSVVHRMFPFFANNVVAGYVAWRPLWWLAAVWPLLLLHLGLELVHAYAWLWLADLPLLALVSVALWRWWPRASTAATGGAAASPPPILRVLFLGLAWLPVALALYVGQSVAYGATGVFWLGRAPAHALFIGFFASVLVAMVTRVTQGHGGRSLAMPPAAMFAFAALQLVALMRIVAEIATDGAAWQAAAATGWLVALTPWVLRIGRIYLAPRADGKPG